MFVICFTPRVLPSTFEAHERSCQIAQWLSRLISQHRISERRACKIHSKHLLGTRVYLSRRTMAKSAHAVQPSPSCYLVLRARACGRVFYELDASSRNIDRPPKRQRRRKIKGLRCLRVFTHIHDIYSTHPCISLAVNPVTYLRLSTYPCIFRFTKPDEHLCITQNPHGPPKVRKILLLGSFILVSGVSFIASLAHSAWDRLG
jgi:hypothetical protein